MTDLERLRQLPLPFARLLGIEFLTASKERVTAEMLVRPELCTVNSVIHGGAIMAFADTLGAAGTVLNLPEGAGTTTIESKTNFLRGLREGYVEATSRPLHVGRTVIVVETDVRDPEDRLVARVLQTQLVLTA
jgi:uncharacterized protein (TIGR00369 family)